MENKVFYIYVLECKDGTLYTGYTNNLNERIKKHEEGKGAKYTRGRGPFKLKYYQTFPTKSDAMKAEIRIKSMAREKKLNYIYNQLMAGIGGDEIK